MTKYDRPTAPARIAIARMQNGDWEGAEDALLDALSGVRMEQANASKEAETA